jgi:uncharacterized membrane protein YoaK (UPF0700 family)
MSAPLALPWNHRAVVPAQREGTSSPPLSPADALSPAPSVMHSRPPEPAASFSFREDPLPLVLLVLTGTTGLVDAVSYLGLGHVFTANMTGNVVFLGFAAVGVKGLSVTRSLASLAAFLLGAAIGGRIATRYGEGPRRRWLFPVALAEGGLLLAAAGAAVGLTVGSSSGAVYPVIALTAVAMGLRNATVRHLAEPDLTTTVLTLTLTGLLADSSLGGGGNPRPVRRVGAVLAMLAGAAAGAAMTLHLGRPLVWPLVAAAFLAVAATGMWARHPSSSRPRAGANRAPGQ